MKSKRKRLLKNILWGVFWLLAGVALAVCILCVPTIQVEPYLKWIVLCFGIVMVVTSCICIAVFSGKRARLPKADDADKADDSSRRPAGAQSAEEKLQQVDLMDELQFVMYVARLYQNKGYKVRLTPAHNSFGVSFVAEAADTATAVICIHSQGSITDVQINGRCVGWRQYPC
ncbi:MAG: restriction endonuclease, partial [Clostridia bacterium]|nr:restriction endonuclease [Clostridia bacterium]